MKVLLALFSCLWLAGCSGQLVCEWQSEDEQFKALIEEVLRETSKDE